MKEFQHQYLNHENRYTNRRYKDDPGVIAVLITNENDLTYHGGNGMLPDKNVPYHNKLWTTGLSAVRAQVQPAAGPRLPDLVAWPDKLYLAQAEHEFNQMMIGDLGRSV